MRVPLSKIASSLDGDLSVEVSKWNVRHNVADTNKWALAMQYLILKELRAINRKLAKRADA